MCGIAGMVRLDGAPVDVRALRRMSEALRHRGPDGDGTWVEGSVGLVHRRLSIIDLDGSPQPMTSADGATVLSFNGEVLNYRELRRQLPYPYRTAGDTEVLLAALVRHGAAAFPLLRGQFATASYDRSTGVLRLARDRVGILPLYWYRDERVLLFGSEPKAIIAALGTVPEVDEGSLDAYLAARAVPAPRTLYAGIRKVRPGHVLEVDRSGRTTETPYWRLEDLVEESSCPPDEAQDRVRAALEAAVRANLVADVPVGAYLSGGLDSSLITALARRARPDVELHTFSAGFGSPKTDETAWARVVSRHLGTTHHEVVVGAEDFTSDWQHLTWHRDAPLSEPADLAVARLASTAREHVKVVLSGEGADELFAGYPKHLLARVAAVSDRVPGRLHRAGLGWGADAVSVHSDRARTALRALAADGEADRLVEWFAPFTRTERDRLLGRVAPRRTADLGPWRSPLHRQLVHDLAGWLPDNLLERGDRMTMASSVELRPPFLDEAVLVAAFSLHPSQKVRGTTGKRVLRQVAEDLLPSGVVNRPKSGFKVPLDAWFRGSLREFARDTLTSPSSFVGSRLSRGAVRELLDGHESGRSNEQIRLWTLLSLEVWHAQSRVQGGGAAPSLTCCRAVTQPAVELVS